MKHSAECALMGRVLRLMSCQLSHLSLGFRPVVVCADDRWLTADFAGRPFDAAFLADLPEGVDACGENGEFHTFVVDGPGFRAPVPVRIRAVETRDVPIGGRSYFYHFARLALG